MRPIWIFSFLIILGMFADRIIFVIFPNYLIEKGFSASQIGLIFSFAGIALVISRLLVGRLSDFFGRKRLMSLGLLLYSASLASFPFLTSLLQFVLFKGLKEFSENLTSTLQDALIADSFPKRIRAKVVSKLGSLYPLSRAGSVLIGILITSIATLAFGFWIASFFIFLSFLIFLTFPEKVRKQSFRIRMKRPSRPLLLIAGISFFMSLNFGVAYFPGFFILAKNLGISTPQLFSLLLPAYLLSSGMAWWSGSWIDRIGRRSSMLLFGLSFSLATFFYALSSTWLSFFAVLMVISLSYYLWRIGFKTSLYDLTQKPERGGQIGFVKMLTGFGDILAPLMGGLVIDLLSLQAAFYLAGLFGLMACCLNLILIKFR